MHLIVFQRSEKRIVGIENIMRNAIDRQPFAASLRQNPYHSIFKYPIFLAHCYSDGVQESRTSADCESAAFSSFYSV